MSRIILNEQAATPATPAAGKVGVFVDNTGLPQLKLVDDAGTVMRQIDNRGLISNFSTANQTGFATDTYLAGSGITIPSGRPPAAGARYRLVFDMVKTAAGTATPIFVVRFGTAGTTSDTARLTFTFAAGTAAIDTGIVEIDVHFRTVGSGTSAVAVGQCRITHHLAATGLTSTGASGTGIILVTSGGFDSTVANSIIGVSFNGGGSFAGTNTLVQAEFYNPSA